MIIKLDVKYEKMLKEIAEVKGGDVAFNDIVENAIRFMYNAMMIVKKKGLKKESKKNG